jgi:hypothetical protein
MLTICNGRRFCSLACRVAAHRKRHAPFALLQLRPNGTIAQ